MRLLTVGHGTLDADDLAALLTGAGVRHLVDIRTAPGSRRHPHVGRAALARWLPTRGVSYTWVPDLGGFRRPDPDSPNPALCNASFRGYADHMRTPAFATALDGVLTTAATAPTAVMCSESLWWRCHRRLVADFATLVRGAEVVHLRHGGAPEPHRLTEGVRRDGDLLVYDGVA